MGIEEIQKICVKLHLQAPPGLDPDPLIEIFGRWRADPGEELVDLADYAHVPGGPLVVLIGKRYNLSLDTAGGRPGIQYSSKKGLEGGLGERFLQVIRATLEKARRLLAEPEFPAGVRSDPCSLEVVLNDRLLAPNAGATDALVRPQLALVLDRLYGAGRYSLRRDPDPDRRLSYKVAAAAEEGFSLEGLLARLA